MSEAAHCVLLRPAWRLARAAKTVNYCACLPSYNVTGLDGKVTPVTNGSCIRTSPGELPWCHVVESTCITPVTRRDNIAFDTCLNLGACSKTPLPQLE